MVHFCNLCRVMTQTEDNYSNRRAHVKLVHEPPNGKSHVDYQRELTRLMKLCYPAYKILNDFMCHECYTQLDFASGKVGQMAHVSQHHMGHYKHRCPWQGCAFEASFAPLQFHIKKVHKTGVRSLKSDAEKARYKKIRDFAKLKRLGNLPRCFPFGQDGQPQPPLDRWAFRLRLGEHRRWE